MCLHQTKKTTRELDQIVSWPWPSWPATVNCLILCTSDTQHKLWHTFRSTVTAHPHTSVVSYHSYQRISGWQSDNGGEVRVPWQQVCEELQQRDSVSHHVIVTTLCRCLDICWTLRLRQLWRVVAGTHRCMSTADLSCTNVAAALRRLLACSVVCAASWWWCWWSQLPTTSCYARVHSWQ